MATREQISSQRARELTIEATTGPIEEMHDRLGVSYELISRSIEKNPKTVYRWRHGETEPRREGRRRAGKLARLLGLLEEIFGPTEDQLAWLKSSVPALGHRRPIDMLDEGELDPIVELLAGLESGAHL